jgi:hypothetical protein
VILAVLLFVAQAAGSCTSVADCRQQALAAEAGADYEAFHDLAWRAVQKGRPNDPDLMSMLARAMSLSGRPGDALVMLTRLADMGVRVDTSGDEFRRVRALKGWPEVEARLAGLPPPPAAPAAAPASAPSAPAPPDAPVVVTPEGEAFAFEAAPFEPAGLGYDEVSKRFLVGDRRASRLMVVDQGSHHVTALVGAASAGFNDTLTGFDIDHRRGDLWVVSTQGDGEAAESRLHKLQLVSGRVLLQVATDSGVRLVDVAVAPDGTVYALDAQGGRLLRLHSGGRALDVAATLGVERPTSLALADDRVAYVGSPAGIVRVDLAAGAVAPLTAPGAMGPVEVLRAHGRSLLVIAREARGANGGARAAGTTAKLVRLVLDSSLRAVTRAQAVDSAVPVATAASVANGTFYYLAGRGQIRAVKLR